jgi:hypothetical protein
MNSYLALLSFSSTIFDDLSDPADSTSLSESLVTGAGGSPHRASDWLANTVILRRPAAGNFQNRVKINESGDSDESDPMIMCKLQRPVPEYGRTGRS